MDGNREVEQGPLYDTNTPPLVSSPPDSPTPTSTNFHPSPLKLQPPIQPPMQPPIQPQLQPLPPPQAPWSFDELEATEAGNLNIGAPSRASLSEEKPRKNGRVFWDFFIKDGYANRKNRIYAAICIGCGERLKGHSPTLANHLALCEESSQKAREEGMEYKEQEKARAKGKKRQSLKESPVSVLQSVAPGISRGRKRKIDEKKSFGPLALDKQYRIEYLKKQFGLVIKRLQCLEKQCSAVREVNAQLVRSVSKLKAEEALEQELDVLTKISNVLADYLSGPLSEANAVRRADSEVKAECYDENEQAAKDIVAKIIASTLEARGATGISHNQPVPSIEDTTRENFTEAMKDAGMDQPRLAEIRSLSSETLEAIIGALQ